MGVKSAWAEASSRFWKFGSGEPTKYTISAPQSFSFWMYGAHWATPAIG